MRSTVKPTAGTVLLIAGLALAACGSDGQPATGTSTVTIEVVNVIDAQGSSLRAELIQRVDYGQGNPTWQLLGVPVDASPFSTAQTLERMPDGDFDLFVVAEPEGGATTGEASKGIGCEYAFALAVGEQVTITIDGLRPFGEKGYGPCNAAVDR